MIERFSLWWFVKVGLMSFTIGFIATYATLLFIGDPPVVNAVNPHKRPAKEPKPQVICLDCYSVCPVCKGRGFMVGFRDGMTEDEVDGVDDLLFFPCDHCVGMVKLQRL